MAIDRTTRPRLWLTEYLEAITLLVEAHDRLDSLVKQMDANGGTAWLDPVIDDTTMTTLWSRQFFLDAEGASRDLVADPRVETRINHLRKVQEIKAL